MDEASKDDLPLRANTNHILVRHYVLDLSVDFHTEVIGGSIVLFLEPCEGGGWTEETDSATACPRNPLNVHTSEKAIDITAAENLGSHGNEDASREDASQDFTLILDCCDLSVSKVEEVDVRTVSELRKCLGGDHAASDSPQDSFGLVQGLMSIPSARWRQQQDLYLQCSRAPAASQTQPLLFHMDRWSLQIRKKGVRCPRAFPRTIRIWYETKPIEGSVKWTKDQDGKCCVYTMGSPINNRALFPCQEPPVAMSTWRARVKAPREYTVLMSGENQDVPLLDETGFLHWDYYVSMPMPASTFTIAVGKWQQAKSLPHNYEEGKSEESRAKSDPGNSDDAGCWPENQSSQKQSPRNKVEDEETICAHVDYPCRFADKAAVTQVVIPHRAFAPSCHLSKAESTILPLLPLCLAAAHSVLGIHPFSRLDVLVVPSGFCSLGMASPHIIFLSQSVLAGDGILCGMRLCHEIAHSWFGLAIGARDWTEEWISEGFATYLEDVFWAKIQQSQMASAENEEQTKLKALLRWRRLKDELENSEEELQVLRPNKDTTGEVSESGASIVKHALNPGKPFMQVHYLKGYFLLTFLASRVGEDEFLNFFRLFVRRFHGQLILSQDFLQMFLDTFPALQSQGISLESVYSDWLDTPGVPKWLGEASSAWSRSPPVTQVTHEVVKWTRLGRGARKGTKRKRARPKVNFKELNPWQLVLLLEVLLEEKELDASCLSLLQTTYKLRSRDAEVKHRWCELVIKHKYASAYSDVKHFLFHDQAMGVYLYGELMLQEDGRQQALARSCLSAVKDEMDQSARETVEEMIL